MCYTDANAVLVSMTVHVTAAGTGSQVCIYTWYVQQGASRCALLYSSVLPVELYQVAVFNAACSLGWHCLYHTREV
jgi:hypothetical protein